MIYKIKLFDSQDKTFWVTRYNRIAALIRFEMGDQRMSLQTGKISRPTKRTDFSAPKYKYKYKKEQTFLQHSQNIGAEGSPSHTHPFPSPWHDQPSLLHQSKGVFFTFFNPIVFYILCCMYIFIVLYLKFLNLIFNYRTWTSRSTSTFLHFTFNICFDIS